MTQNNMQPPSPVNHFVRNTVSNAAAASGAMTALYSANRLMYLADRIRKTEPSREAYKKNWRFFFSPLARFTMTFGGPLFFKLELNSFLRPHLSDTTATPLVADILSGSIGAAIALPFEHTYPIYRETTQRYSSLPKPTPSWTAVFKDVMSNEGVSSVYKALPFAMARDSFFMLSLSEFNPRIKRTAENSVSHKNALVAGYAASIPVSLLAAAVAQFSTSIIYTTDWSRSRQYAIKHTKNRISEFGWKKFYAGTKFPVTATLFYIFLNGIPLIQTKTKEAYDSLRNADPTPPPPRQTQLPTP